ncbi:MAG: hypothetical protein IT290_10615, partial [Deltaproteobacteria bacterium]|nr:hypothetical protein [Deltaproteobacteria bacterium]
LSASDPAALPFQLLVGMHADDFALEPLFLKDTAQQQGPARDRVAIVQGVNELMTPH